MNLIPCDVDCKHQQEGYCCLDQASRVTNDTGGCAYYETKPKEKPLFQDSIKTQKHSRR